MLVDTFISLSLIGSELSVSLVYYKLILIKLIYTFSWLFSCIHWKDLYPVFSNTEGFTYCVLIGFSLLSWFIWVVLQYPLCCAETVTHSTGHCRFQNGPQKLRKATSCFPKPETRFISSLLLKTSFQKPLLVFFPSIILCTSINLKTSFIHLYSVFLPKGHSRQLNNQLSIRI